MVVVKKRSKLPTTAELFDYFFRFGLACFTSLTYRINLGPDTTIALFHIRKWSQRDNLSNLINFYINLSNLLKISHYSLS